MRSRALNISTFSGMGIILLSFMLLFILAGLLQFNTLVQPFNIEPLYLMGLFCVLAAIPLLWLKIWQNNRLCLILASIILITGDYFPAIASPIALLITLPNFVYLFYLNRNSHIRLLITPLVILSFLYFCASFILNFADNPMRIGIGQTGTREINMGFLGSFAGFIVVYHLMYLPLALYQAARTDKDFFKKFIFLLSILINVICLVGLYDFIVLLITQGIPENGIIRLTSIMRRATRLGPFLASSMPLLVLGLLEARQWKHRAYWSGTLMLSLFLLLLTSSRGPISVMVVLWLVMLFILIKRFSLKPLLLFFGGSLLTLLILHFVGTTFELDYFARFQSDVVEAGYEKRERFVQIYLDGIATKQSEPLLFLGHVLFGFGLFSEREYLGDPHNTFVSCFAGFGIVGMVLYYIPYLWLFFVSLFKSFCKNRLSIQLRYGMVTAVLFLFIATGWVHNKLYSPIESAYTWLLVGLLLQEQLLILFPPMDGKSEKPPKKRSSSRLLCLR